MSTIKRKDYFDNIKGILIFLVVFAHCLFDYRNLNYVGLIVQGIYLFHMPAFAFVSGFFGKSEKSQGAASIIRLVAAYFICNCAMGLLTGYENILIPVYSYWYVLALILWRITAKYLSNQKHILLILTLVSLAVGFIPQIDNILGFSRFIAFYPFYMAGYLMPCEKIDSFRADKKRRFVFGFSTAIIAAGVGILLIKYIKCPVNIALMESYAGRFDAIRRAGVMITAVLAVTVLIAIVPDKKIPFVTTMGRNSLCIYLVHRILTIYFSAILSGFNQKKMIILSFIFSLILCIALGNNFTGKIINRYLEGWSEILLKKQSPEKKKSEYILIKLSAAVLAAVMVAQPIVSMYQKRNQNNTDAIEKPIYNVMNENQQRSFDDAFKLVFSGDLILLEDQVKRAYKDGKYDFSDVFEYTEPYISSADFAIGVFEGPMAGESAGYSTSNFDDEKKLALNFPDEFASAVKDTGFDLVTTANNHLFDKGINGAVRTLDVLDRIGLDHTGSYRSEDEKKTNCVKIIEKDGIKFAVLSYTYGTNYSSLEDIVTGKYAFSTSAACETGGELFEEMKKNVIEDFKKAKAQNPDLIIVLPHLGTQFENKPDEEQKLWFNIFKENGADIILGDHSHSVQPVSIETDGDKAVFEAYCPGNFANIYREKQGDTSALVEVYIDRKSKSIIGGGVVPLYTQSQVDGNFRALPIYDIVNNENLRKAMSTDDFERASKAHSIVTNIMLGNEMDISMIRREYLFNSNGYLRPKTTGLKLTEEHKSGVLWSALKSNNSVCFIGDSVTEGTINGGCPWFEPIEEYLKNKTVSNFSKGGCTVSYIIENIDSITKSDLYVIAIGTNDIRYRDESVCAMTSVEYIKRISNLRTLLSEKSPGADFVWIAPWYSTDGDTVSRLNYNDKLKMNSEYSESLGKYAKEHSDGFININSQLKDFFDRNIHSDYLLDFIHPNSSKGVILYSDFVLKAH